MGMQQKMWMVLAAALFVACAGAVPSGADVPRMTGEELRALLGTDNVVVVDVRAGGDWARSDEKIEGAVREDPGSVESWAAKYGKDKTLVLYCA